MRGGIRGVTGPVLGKFRICAKTGLTTGMGANAPIFSARFAPADGVGASPRIGCLITDIRVKAQVITPFTSANETTADVYVARSFTASDSGGTAILPTGINNQLGSIDNLGSAYTTNFTDMRVAAAAALTPGTRTLDANPMLTLMNAQMLAAAGAAQSYAETDITNNTDQRFGLVLQGQTNATAANAEGIVVAVPVAQGAAGTVRYAIEIEWIEFARTGADVF